MVVTAEHNRENCKTIQRLKNRNFILNVILNKKNEMNWKDVKCKATEFYNKPKNSLLIPMGSGHCPCDILPCDNTPHPITSNGICMCPVYKFQIISTCLK